MRSVRFGNLVITQHVFDKYAERIGGHWDFWNREHRVALARLIKASLPECVPVVKSSGQTVLVDLDRKIAYPTDVGTTITKLVTCYPAKSSLVNRAINVMRATEVSV